MLLLKSFFSWIKRLLSRRGNYFSIGGRKKSTGAAGPVTQPFAPPVNTAAPSISGTPAVGLTLTFTPGTWTGSPAPTLTRQWTANGVDILGATGLTYVPVSGDLGKTISAYGMADNGQGLPVRANSSNSKGPVVAASGALSAGTIAFDASHVAGQNPPDIVITTPADGSVGVGNWYRVEFDDDVAFGSSSFTTWREITSDDVITSSEDGGFVYSWGGSLPAGPENFRCFFASSTDGITFTNQSGPSNVISDTIAAAGALAKLDKTTVKRRTAGQTFTNGDLTVFHANAGGGAVFAAGATLPATTNKFAFEIVCDSFTAYAGIYNDVSDMSTGPFAGVPGVHDANGYAIMISEFHAGTDIAYTLYKGGTQLQQIVSTPVKNFADKHTFEVDTSGAAGAHVIRVYRNGTLAGTFTGLTATGMDRAFVAYTTGGQTVTWNPGPTFARTLTAGVVLYG